MRKHLKAENLRKSFKGREVVSSVSFFVREGEVVGLLGPNGAGKTTSFYMVVGLLYPQEGRVFLDDDDITLVPMDLRARRGISYLPQSMSIFRKLSVRNNLLAIMEIVDYPVNDRKRRLNELLEEFQIGRIENSLGASLSGGERRRVEIARSLITNPKFLLLDEPFAGVDPVTVQEIQSIIARLKNDGLGILITDHNVRETLGSCDRAYVLSSGKIVAHGSPQEISSSQLVKDIYLGDKFRL
jgi:lipopolysaccharide export system ATP-binding protein